MSACAVSGFSIVVRSLLSLCCRLAIGNPKLTYVITVLFFVNSSSLMWGQSYSINTFWSNWIKVQKDFVHWLFPSFFLDQNWTKAQVPTWGRISYRTGKCGTLLTLFTHCNRCKVSSALSLLLSHQQILYCIYDRRTKNHNCLSSSSLNGITMFLWPIRTTVFFSFATCGLCYIL